MFRAVQKAGFDPHEFEWRQGPGQLPGEHAPALRHTSGAFFQFEIDGTNHYGYYAPGPQTLGQSVEPRYGSWHSLLEAVERWLEFLRREIETPDLWSELARERELVASPPAEAENTSFTAVEQAQIAHQLSEIKTYVRQTHKLTAAQYEAIDARLDYLVEAASRMGRIDWRNAFVGAFLGAVVQAVIPQDPVRDILALTLRGLAQLFGVDVPELPGGGGSPIVLT